jgi:YebC/PmpR family DNA-binding regulatory protein
MSGHSKWSTIKHKKGAADAKRGKIFTKLIREISIAARQGGGDASSNSRLRHAIQKARDNSMPGENIERAIKRGTGELEGSSLEEHTYEGYGPGGVAIYVEVMTDNRNRTTSEIRHLFSKNGGNLGESGCVSWMFAKKGLIVVGKDKVGEDELLELVLNAGAEDVKSTNGDFEVTTAPEDFASVRKAIEEKGIAFSLAEVSMVPSSTVRLEGKDAQRMLGLMEALEDHDDVQNVYANFDIPEEVMAEAAR